MFGNVQDRVGMCGDMRAAVEMCVVARRCLGLRGYVELCDGLSGAVRESTRMCGDVRGTWGCLRRFGGYGGGWARAALRVKVPVLYARRYAGTRGDSRKRVGIRGNAHGCSRRCGFAR